MLSGHQRNSKVAAPIKPEVQKSAPPIEVPALSLEELKEKTDNFGSKALIGEGSYGRVYYTNLNNGKAVAVKKLDVSSEPESNVEFLTQVCKQLTEGSFLIIFLILIGNANSGCCYVMCFPLFLNYSTVQIFFL